jgi:competence protein ComEA
MAGKRPSRCLLAAAALLLCGPVLIAAAEGKKKQPPAKPLNLNTATAEELQQLPGIGATIAQGIVHLREKSGPFRRVEDLLAVPHITRKTVEAIRPYVTVGQQK